MSPLCPLARKKLGGSISQLLEFLQSLPNVRDVDRDRLSGRRIEECQFRLSSHFGFGDCFGDHHRLIGLTFFVDFLTGHSNLPALGYSSWCVFAICLPLVYILVVRLGRIFIDLFLN